MALFEKMYKDYKYAREGVVVEVFETGFITWKHEQDGGKYLIDMYCTPESRGTGAIYRNYLALESRFKSEGIKMLYSSVDSTDPNCTQMIKYMLKNNYKIYANDGNLIYVKKEI